MKKLLENLKEAIKYYEDCADVCAAENIIANSLVNLHICAVNVASECRKILDVI